MGKYQSMVDKFLINSNLSVKYRFKLWRKIYLLISLFEKLRHKVKKPASIWRAFLITFLTYLSEITTIGTLATT